MTCPECGKENAEGALICAGCGSKLKGNELLGFSKDLAWVSMVLGIVSMLIFPYIYGPLGVAAALVAKKKGYRGKMTTVGLVLGVVSVLGWVAVQYLPSILK